MDYNPVNFVEKELDSIQKIKSNRSTEDVTWLNSITKKMELLSSKFKSK
jgi:hypothetical protein